MTSSFTLNILREAILHSSPWYTVGNPGLLDFGQFDVRFHDSFYRECQSKKNLVQCGPHCKLWQLSNLAIFVLMGVGGGLLGALFNAINTRLTIYRLKHLAKRHWLVRFLEAILIGVTTSILTFGSTISLGHCVSLNFTAAYKVSFFHRSFLFEMFFSYT